MNLLQQRLNFALFPAFVLLACVPATAQEGSLDSSGTRIHFVDTGGPGAPVVLIHSFLSSSALWTNAGFEPSAEYRLVALDLRGHGRSDKPNDVNSYGGEMVDDVLALIETLDLAPAHVVGYSMGAEIALRLAVEHPDAVRSLVVGGSGWSAAPEVEVYGQVGMSLAGSEGLEPWIRSMQPDLPADMIGYMFAALEAHGIGLEDQDVLALAAAAQGMGEIVGLSAAALGGIEVPVLGIAGELDPERPNIERLAEAVPDFRMIVVPGAEHLDAVLDERFRSGVMTFLDGIR